MKAISLSRPWPYTILHLQKRLDNRQRKDGRMPPVCKHRGPLLLHAAKSWDSNAARWLVEHGLIEKPAPTHLIIDGQAPHLHPAGGIVGRCYVEGHIEYCDGDLPHIMMGKPRTSEDPGWSQITATPHAIIYADDEIDTEFARQVDLRWWMHGHWGPLLNDVEPLPFVPCRGHLGVWTVPDDVMEQLVVT